MHMDTELFFYYLKNSLEIISFFELYRDVGEFSTVLIN